MASGNSSNANRYKGQDIDTDGDGSVDDSQTLQGNQPSDLGNTIDQKTIEENSNGDIQVAKNKTVLIGDFENNNFGEWNKKFGSSFVNLNGDGAENTNVGVAYSSDDASIERTIDLTGFKELRLFAKETFPYDNFRIILDGSIKFSDSSLPQSFTEIVLDISQITGSTTIEIEFRTGGNTGGVNVDRIKLKKDALDVRSNATEVDGAGGGTL